MQISVSWIAQAKQVKISHCWGIGSFGALLLPNIGTDYFPKKGMFAEWKVVLNLMNFKFSSQIISPGRTIQMLFHETQLKDICNGSNPFIFKNPLPPAKNQKTLKTTLPMFPGHLGADL